MQPIDSQLQAARAKALQALARREHSRQELRAKLLRHFPERVVMHVLEALARADLQSDARFAESYVRSCCQRGYGPLYIRAELHRHGIEESLIESQLQQLASEWPDWLERIAEKKFGHTKIKDARDWARRGRFLSARGFPGELVHEYLQRLARA